jgi:hypothetical protein
MPKRNKQEKRPADVARLAHHLVSESAKEQDETLVPTRAQISALMSQMGRKGGKIGGKRRLETLSPRRRREIAQKAAIARWKNK